MSFLAYVNSSMHTYIQRLMWALRPKFKYYWHVPSSFGGVRTFDPHIRGSCHCEHQEEEDEEEALQIVGCHSLDAEQDGAQESAL